MKITDVKVFPVDEDKLKAYATITFDNCFIVRDLKVISGNKGFFIAMPSKKRKDGTFRDVAHPLNSETRKMIEDAVLQVYEKESSSGKPPVSYTDYDNADTGSPSGEPEGGAGGEAADPEGEEEAGTTGDLSKEEGAAFEETSPEEPQEEEPQEHKREEKGAEENPVIEPSDDPEKAFGYEE